MVALVEIHLPFNFRDVPGQKFIKNLFVLTDLVDDSVLGSARANLIKLLRVDKKVVAKISVKYSPENLNYYPLNRNSFNDISVKITDTNFKVIETNNSTLVEEDETFIVLHFK